MSAFAFVVVITAIAGVVGTGLGGLLGVLFTRNSEKIVSLLLSFAGGVMLSIVCLDLLSDAINQVPGSVGHVFFVVAMTAVGFCLIYLLNALVDRKTNPQVKHIDKDHPKTADQLSELIHSDHYEEHKKEYEQTGEQKSRRQLFIAGLVMAFAIALHNFPEGMVIGASYASDEAMGGVSGIATAIVIGLHNIPEGMAVSVPLAAGGMGKVKATALTAVTGAPTILGAMLGYFLGSLSPVSLALSLSFASGAMLYVVFGELLPESILMWRSKAPAFAMLVGLLVGVIILFV
ncbi:MAG TPA: ZIP family metal transporter [Candidatus Coproplasma excrementipullorum]|nr:ZIP family metal transporter [Candidatus Coproplasma excrementipullorum]